MAQKYPATRILKRAARYLTPALVFHTDIVARAARGVCVEATDGKKYLDFTSGLAVTNVGHNHPAVVEAASRQMERFVHSGCIFRYDVEVELADRLARITPEGIEMFFFSNSGAEAVEGAIKLARAYTGRQAVVAFTGAFHGRTLGALSLTASSARYRKGYHPLLPGVFHVPYPYCYRCPAGKNRKTCSIECFAHIERLFNHIVTPEEVACVIIEPVLGEGGYVPAPPEYLKKLREFTERRGILLVADEVQCGMGRTGRWFAVEDSGIRPDIITIAKALASGLPLSAVGASRRIMKKWAPGAHGTTFGGNPVACAASLATIEVIEKENLLENAAAMGRLATRRLRRMQKRFYFIGDVRGPGLMIGVEFVDAEGRPDRKRLEGVMKRCLVRGLVIIECGREKNIARLMPPISIKRDELERGLDILEEALG